ncbi:MAG TPA: RNA polymerase sigma factor, partial [Gemmatimonadaceae bacterium]|nr:RNA polymerase sigma factor [Gemmatimonadaceae bacterium]
QHESVVAATVIGMLGRGDEADDVGQETFIRFFNSLDRFRGESSVKTYVQRIAINLALNALKRRRRVASRFRSFDDDEDPVVVADPRADALAEHETREVSEAVHAALDKLPPKHRAVIVLRMIDGRSTRETAEILRVPEGTVLSRLARAMKQLETHLQPYMRLRDAVSPGAEP